MIVHIQGEVVRQGSDHVVIEMGGLGIKVFVTAALAKQCTPGEKVFLYTYFVVREDAWSLYGFETEQERDYFILILGVNGVGPRSALQVLSSLSVDAIRRAVLSEQPEIFARVPGIGKKTAPKILLHLQGKLGEPGELAAAAGFDSVDHEVLDALTALGYSLVEAQSAIQSIPRDAPNEVEERLRIALQFFSR